MPNTLAHIALNTITTRNFIKNSELFWIYIGCLLPDFPWILRKIVAFITSSINAYDLQAYAIVQSSFLFCVILSGVFSIFTNSPKRTFFILIIGSVLHLILDSIQIKWANGVLFLAPFSWELTTFDIFWPDNWINYIITILGLITSLLMWKNIRNEYFYLSTNKFKYLISSSILILYLITPVFFITNVYNADNHFITTLRNVEERTGKYVELDRKAVHFDEVAQAYYIESFDKELIEIIGVQNLKYNVISVQGYFSSTNTINVTNIHGNWTFFRDGSSYLGIFLIMLSLGVVTYNSVKKIKNLPIS